jgi:hypothetical protein
MDTHNGEPALQSIRRGSVSGMHSERLKAIRQIVHEYARLLSAGKLSQQRLDPVVEKHVQVAFWVSCRKMGRFFGETTGPHVVACHYVQGVTVFDLPVWDSQKSAITKQLAHLRYTGKRDESHHDPRMMEPLLEEFQRVWSYFCNRLKPPERGEFEVEIASRAADGAFSHVQLRSDSRIGPRERVKSEREDSDLGK